jgi:phosphoribosylformimino-5-aminoimidazole carboxamide ribotide isomerase
VKNPAFAKEACRAFPGQVAVGIDARDGMVATEGWAETSDVSALDLALSFEDAGAAAIIHTDIDRDGMLGGVNVAATAALGARLSTPVIASGGVAGVEDIVALKAAGTVAGTIIGRALYDGRLSAADAIAAAAQG